MVLTLLHKVSNANIHSITWSERATVSMSLEVRCSANPTIMWRTNTSLLSKHSCQVELKTRMQEYFLMERCSTVIFSLWCSHKAHCRGLLIQMAARDKRQRMQALAPLLSKIKQLETQHKSTTTLTLTSELQKCRQNFKLLLISDYEKSLKKLKALLYFIHRGTEPVSSWPNI